MIILTKEDLENLGKELDLASQCQICEQDHLAVPRAEKC